MDPDFYKTEEVTSDGVVEEGPVPEEKPAPKKTDAAEPPIVYVGPNLGGDILMTQFQSFTGGLPAHIEPRMEADPNFAALFVPAGELANTRKKLADPASPISRAFRAVVKTYRPKK